MFRHLDAAARDGGEIAFSFAGKALRGRAGMSLAAALLANGFRHWREHPLGGEARGPLCLMGVCFECLIEVEGLGTVQACLTPLREGMRLRPAAAPVVNEPPR